MQPGRNDDPNFFPAKHTCRILLEKAGYTVTFGQWMTMAVPFCTAGTVLVRLCIHTLVGATFANFLASVVPDSVGCSCCG